MARRYVSPVERHHKVMKRHLRTLKGLKVLKVDTRLVDGEPNVVGVLELEDGSKLQVSWVAR